MKRLRVMTDYLAHPLWRAGPTADDVGPVDPATLPLSEDTIKDLAKWQEVYDQRMNWNDPAASPRWTPEETAAFDQEGFRLWLQVRSQLGSDYHVSFFSETLGRTIDRPEDFSPNPNGSA